MLGKERNEILWDEEIILWIMILFSHFQKNGRNVINIILFFQYGESTVKVKHITVRYRYGTVPYVTQRFDNFGLICSSFSFRKFTYVPW